MAANSNTLEYLRMGVANLIGHGSFRNGLPFRPTQRDALYAYSDYLNRDNLTLEEKLSGFFILPTGTGKTALFLSILDEAHRVARAAKDELRAMVVVPTTTLLQQMKGTDNKKGDIEKWAPDYLNTTGFYGGKYRQLGQELSVIIYNSWVKLMEEGKIDSSKIDILVSDEAHRGTSERRVSNQFNAFANGTAQIAFTATAHFDEEKSVEQSHGRLIFERSLPDAVRLDELAAYIQTQLHIIRVAPLDALDEFTEAADVNASVRAGLRQEAWMRNMVNILREGRDALTGDLLSDNKSGFYVGDTAMADRTAELLCADPVLKQRALERGCTDVAVSIHSKDMSQKMQDDLLEDFVQGKYMVCVSDSKLKEGFDDPTLKNVFDYPRGSLVDKAQIIGRAARKWFNEAKGRFEGATIIDTIVYIGSNDPDEDQRLKEDAIRKAIMAWSVLEGTAVFSEKIEEEITRNHKGGMGGFGSPVLGMDVESFVTLEEVQAIHARQQELLEDNRIPLTDEMRSTLRAHIERTGLGPKAIITKNPNLFNIVSYSIIEHWKHSNSEVKTAHKDIWDLVIEAYASMPDSAFISLTKEMRLILSSHMQRTGMGAQAFVNMHPEMEEDIDKGRLHAWKTNDSGIKNVPQDIWISVISAYEKIPDAMLSEKIPLTDNMKAVLNAHMERTGKGPLAFLSLNPDVHVHTNYSTLKNWRNPKSSIKRVSKVAWDAVIDAYEMMPDAEEIERILITDEMRLSHPL